MREPKQPVRNRATLISVSTCELLVQFEILAGTGPGVGHQIPVNGYRGRRSPHFLIIEELGWFYVAPCAAGCFNDLRQQLKVSAARSDPQFGQQFEEKNPDADEMQSGLL